MNKLTGAAQAHLFTFSPFHLFTFKGAAIFSPFHLFNFSPFMSLFTFYNLFIIIAPSLSPNVEGLGATLLRVDKRYFFIIFSVFLLPSAYVVTTMFTPSKGCADCKPAAL